MGRACMPLAEAAALDGAMVSAEAVLNSVFLCDEATKIACLGALDDDDDKVLRTIQGLVPPEDCRKLREYCDDRVFTDLASDNVDRLPDFQVNLDSLDGVISPATATKLLALPRLLDHAEPFRRIGIFVRRYTPDTRPFFPWHVDGNAFTANVHLSPPNAHRGGHLRLLRRFGVLTLDRHLGDVTLHTNAVCHAVSPVDSGIRHSLLIFFHT